MMEDYIQLKKSTPLERGVDWVKITYFLDFSGKAPIPSEDKLKIEWIKNSSVESAKASFIKKNSSGARIVSCVPKIAYMNYELIAGRTKNDKGFRNMYIAVNASHAQWQFHQKYSPLHYVVKSIKPF